MNSLTHSICLRCSLRFVSASARQNGIARLAQAFTFATFAGDKIPSQLTGDLKKDTKTLVPSPSSAVVVASATKTDEINSSISSQANKLASDVKTATKTRRKKLSGNPEESHTANVFVTPERAYSEYLLTTTDLSGLWNTKRRSPFDGRPDITVYLRADVEKRAVDVWGSLARLEKEKQRRREEQLDNAGEISLALLTAMRNYSAAMDTSISDEQRIQKMIKEEQENHQTLKLKRSHLARAGDESFMVSNESDRAQNQQLKGSGRVVWAAIGVNFANFVMKLGACLHTGSSAMFSEAVHSLADTLNQAILAVGIHQSKKIADPVHPYGWYNVTYVSSLISGVGIFFVGAGLSWYHGVQALIHPEPLESVSWALLVLAGSFITEGASLLVGIRQIRREAAAAKLSFFEYVRRGYDPSVNVVLAEDCVAVFGVGVAASCLGLAHFYSSHVPDAVGSLIIGTLLAGVASHIVYTNAIVLVGHSIPEIRREQMRSQLEADRIIRAVHDMKATEMGGRRVRFKAEIDIDGRELTRIYLDRIDMDILLIELQKASKSTEDLEAFMLRHGEGIVDLIGAEIDRVEKSMKKKYPELRHVDLEVL